MKKYILPTIFTVLSFSCFIIYNGTGSYVREDGLLVEPFGLILAGLLLFVFGISVGAGISTWSLFHNPKKYDKWIFGICIIILVVFSLYITASMIYFTEQVNEEVLQISN